MNVFAINIPALIVVPLGTLGVIAGSRQLWGHLKSGTIMMALKSEPEKPLIVMTRAETPVRYWINIFVIAFVVSAMAFATLGAAYFVLRDVEMLLENSK